MQSQFTRNSRKDFRYVMYALRANVTPVRGTVSGPAKAAQAESGNWIAAEVFVSCLIAGAVVAIVSEPSLLVAVVLRKTFFENTRRLAIYLIVGKFAEVTILFALGLLSFWNAFSFWFGLGALNWSILASGALMSVLWMAYWNRLMTEQLVGQEKIEEDVKN